MKYLKEATKTDQISLYTIEDQYHGNIRRFLYSTAPSRSIINDPFVLGVNYTQKLQRSIELFLKEYKKYWLFDIEEKKVNVMHFLRGGLNFYLRDALANAYDWNNHGASFLSSQRAVDEEGRWYVKEDSYEKVTIGKGNTIFLGDVVATGVTLDHGLNSLTKFVKSRKGSIRYLVFFTIGCHKAEKTLEKYYDLWKKTFADFEGIDLVYIEGKFHLANTKTPVNIKLLGTDLLKRDSILAPELVASQNEKITYPLERCAIYDAGSRAFDIPEYVEDVIEYWKQIYKLAEKGTTLNELLKERYPEIVNQLDIDGQDLEEISRKHLDALKVLL